MRLPYQLARLLTSIAERQAVALEAPLSIAVVDGEGGLLCFGRMDGALPVSVELAVSKAFTAAVLRMATHELSELAQPGKTLYGIQQTHQGRIVLFGGGFPLPLHGQVIGAIGVSGGTVEQDIEVGESAVAALQEMEVWRGHMGINLHFRASAEIPPIQQLEKRLQEELAKMNCPLPREKIAVLSGAVLLAALASQVAATAQ